MKKLLIATHNQGKVRELGELLEPLGINTISAAGLNLPEPEETADTFHGNAKLKSIPAAIAANLPALADDSGLCIPALDGAPGIYSARWGGENKDFAMAIERVKSELSNLPSYQEGLGEVQYREFNSKNLYRAKELRTNSTEAEKKLWNRIRNRQINDCKFRRQEPLGNYIVDFICLEKKLIIELDGGQHQDKIINDNQRTKYLESIGYQVIRFWNNEVIENIEAVLEVITQHLNTSPTPPNRRGLLWPSGAKAYFICVLSLAQPDGSSVEFEGRIDGTLTFPPRGKNGFGYDPIFIPERESRTFGEMSQLEKNKSNHRADAFDKFKKYLLKKPL